MSARKACNSRTAALSSFSVKTLPVTLELPSSRRLEVSLRSSGVVFFSAATEGLLAAFRGLAPLAVDAVFLWPLLRAALLWLLMVVEPVSDLLRPFEDGGSFGGVDGVASA